MTIILYRKFSCHVTSRTSLLLTPLNVINELLLIFIKDFFGENCFVLLWLSFFLIFLKIKKKAQLWLINTVNYNKKSYIYMLRTNHSVFFKFSFSKTPQSIFMIFGINMMLMKLQITGFSTTYLKKYSFETNWTIFIKFGGIMKYKGRVFFYTPK